MFFLRVPSGWNDFGSTLAPEETVKINAPIKDVKEELGYRMTTLEMLEPFSVISYLWQDVGVKVSKESVEQWWKHHREFGAKWAEYSSASLQHVPLTLYGDAARTRQVPFGPPGKVLGLFLSCPLFRPKSASASRWLLFSIDEYLLFGHKTMDAVLTRLTWSLNCLYTGVYPKCGPAHEALTGSQAARAGQPICGGTVFAVCQLRGDWVWHKDLFRLKSSWKSGATQPVCFLCPAMARGTNRYYNVGDSSPLWQQQFSFCQFLCQQIPASKPCHLDALCASVLCRLKPVVLRHCLAKVLYWACGLSTTPWSGMTQCMW